MANGIEYEIVHRRVDHPSGQVAEWYEIAAIGPNGARSTEMSRTYKTENEAQAEIDRRNGHEPYEGP